MDLTSRIGVIGLGTIGRQELNLLRGHLGDVVGYDNSSSALTEAESTTAARTGRFTFTTDHSLLGTCTSLIFCLPTAAANGHVSLAAFEDIVHKLRGRVHANVLLIVASSVPIGFTRTLAGQLGSKSAAAVPERYDPGRGLELAAITRVVGGIDDRATDLALEHYGAFDVPVKRVASAEIAEASKVLENAFRLLNIAFINEFADVCGRLGLAAADVIEAAATKPFGFMPHYPSSGAGGVCIPVVPHYLLTAAADTQGSVPILAAALRANEEQPERIARMITATLSRHDAKILVVGATYKPDYKDSRGSTALRLIQHLATDHTVEVLDPVIDEREIPEGMVLHRATPIGHFDAIVIAVRHRSIKLDDISALAPVLFDVGRGEIRGGNTQPRRTDVPQLTRN